MSIGCNLEANPTSYEQPGESLSIAAPGASNSKSPLAQTLLLQAEVTLETQPPTTYPSTTGQDDYRVELQYYILAYKNEESKKIREFYGTDFDWLGKLN